MKNVKWFDLHVYLSHLRESGRHFFNTLKYFRAQSLLQKKESLSHSSLLYAVGFGSEPCISLVFSSRLAPRAPQCFSPASLWGPSSFESTHGCATHFLGGLPHHWGSGSVDSCTLDMMTVHVPDNDLSIFASLLWLRKLGLCFSTIDL